MKTPSYSCKIEAYCSLNPSEDPTKVEQSILNLLDDCKIKKDKFSISGISERLESLEKIYESIHSKKSQHSLRRNMNQNLDHHTTWFYLNKQAAFANNVAICEEADESPLGPIKIILTSRNIEEIISWLTN
ncbi:MAG: RNA-binding domain-containing protein [Nitrosopumilaceae archaeon]|nr:RNA-binding domain-containing protein [Nitrosopumilaceae archaeon]